MYFSSQKVLSLLILGSPGKFSPVQQTALPPNSNSDVGPLRDHNGISDVEYGYKGPGVYHITSSNDRYNLARGHNGSGSSGDGAPVVVWYVFYPARITMVATRQSNDEIEGSPTTLKANAGSSLTLGVDM